MTKHNNQAAPRLRFQGFDGAWEEKTLGEVASVERGKFSARPRNDPRFFGGKIPFIQTGDITNSNLYLQNYTQTLNDEGLLVSKTFPKNTLLMTIAANIGDTAITQFEIACPDSVVAIQVDLIQSEIFFLKYILDLKKIYLDENATQNAQKNINLQILNPLEIKLPTLPEQTQIGQFFQTLDRLIAQSKATLSKSRQLKKAMLAKMFPAADETVPQIRFKGFTGAWERKKFSDIAQLQRGLTYSPFDISQHGIRVLRSSNIDEDCYIEKDDDVFVCESAVKIPLVENGDILITSANGSSRLVGKHTIIQTKTPAVHGGFMILAKTENPYFLNASMSSAWYYDFIRIFVAGGNGAIGNLSISDLNEQEIQIPTSEEQTAIGNFFRQLDDTIALQALETEKLGYLKKALLAAMLV